MKIIQEAQKVVFLTDFKNVDGKDFSEYMKTHLALKELVEEGIVDQIITENHDGLQRLAGVKGNHLFEINGNDFTEYCGTCREPYIRDFKIKKTGSNETGRHCLRCTMPLVSDFSKEQKHEVTNAALFAAFQSKAIISFGNNFQNRVIGDAIQSAISEGAKLGIVYNGNQNPIKRENYENMAVLNIKESP